MKPKQQEFFERLNRDFRVMDTDPESFFAFAKAVRDHDVHLLIENSTQTYDAYWMLMNLGINVTVAQAQDLYRITKSVKKTDLRDSEELAYNMRRRLAGEVEFATCTMPPKERMYRREMCRAAFFFARVRPYPRTPILSRLSCNYKLDARCVFGSLLAAVQYIATVRKLLRVLLRDESAVVYVVGTLHGRMENASFRTRHSIVAWGSF